MEDFSEFKLHPQILKGVSAAGYSKPFPIQEQTISPLLRGSDIIGQARTGTGKTAAFALPMLNGIKTKNYEVQALVLAHTRELAMQITAEVKKLGKHTGIKALTIYGGQSIHTQLSALNRGVHVVVGTPGRVIDHIKRGTLQLDWVKFVVLDEADTMLEMGFVDDVEFILDTTPRERQLSLFSATMPQKIIELSRKYMDDPERILIDSDELSVDTLKQYYTVAEHDAKFELLVDLLAKENPESSMVFCRTRYGVRKLARDLEYKHLNAVALHGDLSQHQRDQAMNLFRSGRADILVATDVASRGIDVRQVDCVINYEVPENPLLYFHRVGRTARAGDAGRSYTFVSRREFGDFAQIRSRTKANIRPLKEDDRKHVMRIPPNGESGYSRYKRRSNFGRGGGRSGGGGGRCWSGGGGCRG